MTAKIVDNRKEVLAEVLKRELAKANEIMIATAYFNIRGWGAIKEALVGKPLKLLLGKEPTESLKWEDEILKELEENEDDPEYFKLLQEVVSYFGSPEVEVRILEMPFFHGKAYLGISGPQEANGVAVVGSSNFTYAGLVKNRELNMVGTDPLAVQQLFDWFQEAWKMARDFKEEFLSMLKNYTVTWTPLEVLAKALYESYREGLEQIEEKEKILEKLYPHQRLSVVESRLKLQRWGGVLIADSTGLGKTRVALALAHDAMPNRTLLIAPKSVLETTWREEMRKMNIQLESVNSEMLSSNPEGTVKKFLDPENPLGLIIVDEAHQFRHPSTNRYQALAELINRSPADVILLTATPVNTSLMDLYFLLSLYLPDRALEGESLRGYFTSRQKEWLKGKPVNMDEVLRRFVVRISRAFAKELSKEVKFPERKLLNIRYSLPFDPEKIIEALGSMDFKCYDFSVEKLSGKLRLPNGKIISEAMASEKLEQLKVLVKMVVRINLLKRLESSLEAFRRSLNRMEGYLERAAKYAKEKGIFIPPRVRGEVFWLIGEEEEEGEFPEPEEVLKYPELVERCRLTPAEVEEFLRGCEKDREKIQELLRLLPERDTKLERVEAWVEEILPSLTGNNGIIIFTQYADTARYLYERFKHPSLFLVTGEGARGPQGRRMEEAEGVEEFRKRGGLMVSTDILSTGQNLQNAQYVVNYDFPWNPVILIQRAGRVDRIGSPHPVVYLTNLFPEEDTLERFLGLMEKLYRRLEAIRSTVGLDASVLGEEPIPKDFTLIRALSKEDHEALRFLETQMEQFTNDPANVLAEILREKGKEWLEKLPYGIGSFMEGEREALFVAFTDGKEIHWRLRYFDKPQTETSPVKIIEILKGSENGRGERIDYEKLVERLRLVKLELIEEMERKKIRQRTRGPLGGRKTREIYEKLSHLGDEGEKLAAGFREVCDRITLVNQLYRAMKEGRLLEEAKRVIPPLLEESKTLPPAEEIKLKRICWCWISPHKK
ncbi:MAG: hypothetical protein DSO02_03790 [Hadesarchaea archaeon]|nr:MAG: hypothetical protein DSO02_03790 [Hadesarchaea archaeon]